MARAFSRTARLCLRHRLGILVKRPGRFSKTAGRFSKAAPFFRKVFQNRSEYGKSALNGASGPSGQGAEAEAEVKGRSKEILGHLGPSKAGLT